jgi:hypothetical protein
MKTDDLLALARKHNARVSEVPYDGITFTRAQLQRFAADVGSLDRELTATDAAKRVNVERRAPLPFADRRRK